MLAYSILNKSLLGNNRTYFTIVKLLPHFTLLGLVEVAQNICEQQQRNNALIQQRLFPSLVRIVSRNLPTPVTFPRHWHWRRDTSVDALGPAFAGPLLALYMLAAVPLVLTV